ncbi:MAG: TIGR01777 family protein, partial [Pedobacter sp.]
MNITITGGTGLVGRALTKALLNKGHHVYILTREVAKKSAQENVKYASWNVAKGIIDVDVIKNSEYIFHLAGAGIADKRWTPKYKEKILNSRVEGSKLLSNTIRNHATKLKSVICASATGWYGADKNSHAFIESDNAADDFLGEVCRQWEESLQPGSSPVAHIRTGIVLSNNGGAYPKLTMPIQYGIAPILGNGKQVMSWIHIDDVCRIFLHAIQNEQLKGVYNAVAPSPAALTRARA